VERNEISIILHQFSFSQIKQKKIFSKTIFLEEKIFKTESKYSVREEWISIKIYKRNFRSIAKAIFKTYNH